MRTLHITNGDAAGDTLKSFVSGDVTITADPLHEGPARAVEGDEWRRMRPQFLANPLDPWTPEDMFRSLTSWDTAIERAPEYDEVVLWFEHDLFDQLLLIRTIDLVGRVLSDPASPVGGSKGPALHQSPRVSLICIGAFPGVERFIGLGQLNADQLASLDGERRPVTDHHYEIAREAWNAFRASDPTELFRLMVRLEPDRTYEFLPDALRRFFEEYPSTGNGLSRSAHAMLQALGDGPLTGRQLFARTQAGEARPFMGDLTFFAVAQRLASARVPLILIDGPDPADVGGATISPTAAGRDVAAGRQDAVAINGIDEWRGGVHLHGRDRSPWRWDADRETLLS